MMMPAYIQEILFKTLFGSMDILAFEQWLYHDKEIEYVLKDDDYLELISFGYRERGAKTDLNKILERLVDKPEYEKWRLLEMLKATLMQDARLPEHLMAFYDLYCHGYDFFYTLGIKYGLNVECPYSYGANNWEELPARDQQILLNSFYPEIEDEVYKVMAWLNKGLVVPLGKIEERDYTFDGRSHMFIDNRNEEDKKLE